MVSRTAKTMRRRRNGRVFLLSAMQHHQQWQHHQHDEHQRLCEIDRHLRDFIMFACGTTTTRTTAEESLAEPAIAKFPD